MAIGTSSTQCGNGPSATSGTAWTLTTTAALDVGEVGVLRTSSDNISTVDGDNNEVVSVTGGTGTWEKLSEYTNSQGAAAAGVTISAWVFTPSGTNAIGTVFTVTLASARTQKVAALEKWTVASGNSLRQTAEAAVVDSQVDAGAGFGSSSFTGLSSLERLYLRVLGAELSTTAPVAPTASFTALSSFRSSTSSPVAVLGEFRVNTSTGETSNPSFTPTADKAGMFFALEEYTPSGGAIVGTAAITLGDATASSQGVLPIAGAAAVTLGSLVATSAGSLPIKASAAITLGNLGQASVGSLPIAGASAVTLGSVGLVATGSAVAVRTGSAAITLGSLGVTSGGALPIKASAAVTLGSLGVTSGGALPIKASASITLGSVGLVATGTSGNAPATGSASITLGVLTSVALGELTARGSAAITLGGLGLASAGSVGNQGQAVVTLGGLGLVAIGRMGVPSVVRFLDYDAKAKPISFSARAVRLFYTAKTTGNTTMERLPPKLVDEIWRFRLDCSAWVPPGATLTGVTGSVVMGPATVDQFENPEGNMVTCLLQGGTPNTYTTFEILATMSDGQIFGEVFSLYVT